MLALRQVSGEENSNSHITPEARQTNELEALIHRAHNEAFMARYERAYQLFETNQEFHRRVIRFIMQAGIDGPRLGTMELPPGLLVEMHEPIFAFGVYPSEKDQAYLLPFINQMILREAAERPTGSSLLVPFFAVPDEALLAPLWDERSRRDSWEKKRTRLTPLIARWRIIARRPEGWHGKVRQLLYVAAIGLARNPEEPLFTGPVDCCDGCVEFFPNGKFARFMEH